MGDVSKQRVLQGERFVTMKAQTRKMCQGAEGKHSDRALPEAVVIPRMRPFTALRGTHML